jgi:hypothetical protein
MGEARFDDRKEGNCRMNALSTLNPLKGRSHGRQAATGTQLCLALACSTALTFASAVASADSPSAPKQAPRFELAVDANGHLSAREIAPKTDPGKEGLTNLDDFTGMAAQPPLDKLAAALLRFVARSHELICDIPVSPSTVAFTFEVVQIQWSKKVLCQPHARLVLQQALEDSRDESGTPGISFNFPKNLLNFSKFEDQFDRQKQLEAFQKFSSELVSFFCRMPVRPDELSLKVLPAKVEWDISNACKHQD